MNYKKIFKSQKLRFVILKLLSFVPDKTMIKLQYKIKTGRKLNLKNPERFSEKLQWYKLYYRTQLMKKCADKYEVRKYVESKGLSFLLNDLYGVYDNPKDIDFNKLPNKFVLKTTLGSGGHNVLICNDKSKINFEETQKLLQNWQKDYNKKSYGREWAYDEGNNRIIAEKLIESNNLVDYKFFAFNGKINYLYVISERKLGKYAELGIYDTKFNKINAYRTDESRQKNQIVKPKNFDEMLRYAEILSKDFPHARIDFYNLNGKILFGEITFYDGSGYIKFDPDEFDYELGKTFDLVGDIHD